MHEIGRSNIAVLIPLSYEWNEHKNKIFHKKFNNKHNIVEHNIALLRKCKFKNIYTINHIEYKNKHITNIINHNVQFYNDTYGICLAFNEIKEKNILIINPFTFFFSNIFRNFTFKTTETVYYEDSIESKKNIGISINEEGYLNNIVWGLPNVWSQMLFISEQDYNEFYKIICLMKNYKLYFFEIINKLSDIVKIKCYKTKNTIIQIEENSHFLNAKKVYNET